MYQIQTEKFTGPLDLLLQLVEKRNLEITEISLAQVTQDYILYINNQTLITPQALADFLVIASTLLLIKSRAILPSLVLKPEEEEEITDLEEHLRLYKFYKEQGENVRKIFNEGKYCYSRPPEKNWGNSFLPPPDINLNDFVTWFETIFRQWQEEIQSIKEEKKIRKIVTLQERINSLLHQLTKGKDYRLDDLIKERGRKIDIIITFLALLHLSRQNLLTIKQKGNFQEIWISNQS